MAVILASASPRRRELLEMLGVRKLTVIPARGEERAPEGAPAAEAVEAISRAKALEVAEQCSPGDVIIAADTVVCVDGDILGKPRSEEEARGMLRRLSGRAHEVFTGVCLHDAATGREMVEEVRTAVRFRELTDKEIWDYIHTGEPMDKAGAYGIQGGAGAFVEGLDGSFENVMGFPVDDVERMLRAFTKEG